MSEARFRPAATADLAALLPVVREFHAHEHIAWNPVRVQDALEALLADTDLGRLTLIERDGELAGYLLVGFCFSLEFGGRYGLLDELYVRPEYRGGGVGKRALQHVEAICREQGFACVRLEVSDDNPHARGIYRRHQYMEHPRRLMTRWLDRVGADQPHIGQPTRSES